MKTTNNAQILCVDDETTGLMVRKLTLESKGYRALTAESGPEGLSVFSQESVDLVVLDYMMPVMNGHEVANRMRQIKPSVPILLLSAYVDLPQETLALVDRYVMKGEGPIVLLAAIADLLDGGARPRRLTATRK